ncbi:MAG: hypothetical protein IPK97_05580 [Ahniella sp.]|nr:hypothetical protein [Ahniella sp.]
MTNPIVTTAVSKLKYPWLLGLTLAVFVADVLIPDFLPFVDEIMLAAMTALFATWRERRAAPPAQPPIQTIRPNPPSQPPRLP